MTDNGVSTFRFYLLAFWYFPLLQYASAITTLSFLNVRLI